MKISIPYYPIHGKFCLGPNKLFWYCTKVSNPPGVKIELAFAKESSQESNEVKMVLYDGQMPSKSQAFQLKLAKNATRLNVDVTLLYPSIILRSGFPVSHE